MLGEGCLVRSQVAALHVGGHHDLQAVATGRLEGIERTPVHQTLPQQLLPQGIGIVHVVDVHHEQSVQHALLLMPPLAVAMIHAPLVGPVVHLEGGALEHDARECRLGCTGHALAFLGLHRQAHLPGIRLLLRVLANHGDLLPHYGEVKDSEQMFPILHRNGLRASSYFCTNCHRLYSDVHPQVLGHLQHKVFTELFQERL